MKKNLMLLFAAAVMLNSCGTAAHLASSDQEHKFQDGIYSSSPDRITRSEKVTSKAKTDSLAAMTRLIIPDNTQPVTVEKIKPLQKSDATTIIVVNDNPWDWRNNIDVWYSYNPYSVWNHRYSSSWYWNSWAGPSWHYRWNDPWYYRWNDPWYHGWADPWYYRWNDPWYYGWADPWHYRWHDPWYCGWGDPWHHHHWGYHYPYWGPHYGPIHHHKPGFGPGHGHEKPKDIWVGNRHKTESPDVSSGRSSDRTVTTNRRGIGTSSSTSRAQSVSGNRTSTGRRTSVQRVQTTTRSESTKQSGSTGSRVTGGRTSTSAGRSGTVSGRTGTSSGRSATSGQNTNYRRPKASAESGSQTRSSSSGSNSSSYERNTQSRSSYGGSSSSSSYRGSSSSGSYSRGSSSGSSGSSGRTGGGRR